MGFMCLSRMFEQQPCKAMNCPPKDQSMTPCPEGGQAEEMELLCGMYYFLCTHSKHVCAGGYLTVVREQ